MSDSISKEISKIKENIFMLLKNNDLNKLKQLNFIENEKEKNDYIEFILLTLYSELGFFDKKRVIYCTYIDNKKERKEDLKKTIKSLNYINENIMDHIPSLTYETMSKFNNYTNENITLIQERIEQYKRYTEIILKLQKAFYLFIQEKYEI